MKAEGVLSALEEEFRPLLAPKLLAEAKSAQVVWARVKGYPAWPAQVLTEAAALRRKDLGQERHSKGNSVPVMFFGTVEVAWVKDADVVDFKEGLYQGFFDRKTKHFRLALEQVCEYLALDRKRKAPPKWWCKPPSNGLDDQSDGPSPKLASASGNGAARGAGQRHDVSKGSRQRSTPPVSDAVTSSEEDEALAAQTAGTKRSGKAASGKEGAASRPVKEAAASLPALKPRDSSNGRLARDNGSTAASTNTAGQAQAKKPPAAPLAALIRQPGVAKEATPAGYTAKSGKEAREGAPAASVDVKAPPASQASQQQPQQRLRSSAGAPVASPKENEAGLPPRKRLKVESCPGPVLGPTAASASSLPPPPPPAAAKRTMSVGEDVGELNAAMLSDVDVLKLPAEIRRLAGIRLPALPKKPGVKVEESTREQPLAKAEPAAGSAAANGPMARPEPAAAGESGCMELRCTRPRRSSSATRAGQPDVRASGAGQGQRCRSRRRSSSGAESQSSESSDEEEDGLSSSGVEADSEVAVSSGGEDGSDASEESEDDTMAATTRRSGRGTVATRSRGQNKQAVVSYQRPLPARDRKGEKQRRLARLAAPEPANRRTSSRLMPKAPEAATSKRVISENTDAEDSGDESEKASDEDSEEGVEGEDERSSLMESSESGESSSSSGESEIEERAGKGSGGSDLDGGIRLRSRTRASQLKQTRSQRNSGPGAGKGSSAPPSQGPKRKSSLPQDAHVKESADAKAADEENKSQRREVTGASAPSSRALPLELRRLQDSHSAGVPTVDTSEPRTLRDRTSPARRATGYAGVTSTQTATGGASAGGKRSEKRGSEDGSGASVVERSRSPELRQEGNKSGSDMEAKLLPRSTRSQAFDGRCSKASSVAGSASPPPAPLPGAVPVRKKPPSLGVPSTARSAGQATARQLPAITPARVVLRSLASTSDVQLSGTLPLSGCAGTSAAGTVLAPTAVCVPKKPSTGPPTRRLVESGLDAPLSSTELPDVISLECDADAKHASSPDVAAAATAVACDGQLPLSPGATLRDDVGVRTQEAAMLVTDKQPANEQAKQLAEQQLEEPPVPERLQRQEHIAGHQEQDVSMSDTAPACAGAHPELVPEAEVAKAKKLVADQPLKDIAERRGAPEDAVVVPRQALEPEMAAAAGPEQQDQIDPQPSSCLQQALTVTLTEPVEQAAALTSRSSIVHDQEFEPADRSPERALLTPAAQLGTDGQATFALGPQTRNRPGSPVHDAVLLSEEQLPDQGEAMAEHDGRSMVLVERLTLGDSAGGSDPPCAGQGAVAASETAREFPSMPGPAIQSVQGHLASVSGAVDVSAPPPCAGSCASSEAGCGDGVPGGVSGASCSAALWGEDDDAAARARARELEELGEVAAALAGLHQAEVPRLPLPRSPVCQMPSALQPDSLLDRIRVRGTRGSRDNLAALGPTALDTFRWPQPEPVLPSQEQPFSVPRDWLVTRPPRYEPVRRNVWFSRLKPKRLPKDEISICACRPPPFSAPGELQRMGCGPNCLNRLSSILCDSKLCPCSELCSNRSLHLLRQPRMEVFLTENRGWGVRAVEPLSKGAFIIEYAGEVIDERELGRRMDHARMNGEPHFYIMELSAGLYIDARRKGNIARLINSSCDPNCETQKWHDASTGEVRVGIFATRDIAPGEELVYDYFFSTYGALKPSAASFVCMCGAKNCRGTMDLHPEKRRDLGRRMEVFWDADGQYYRAVIVAYHPTSKKHTVMYEDGGTEKLSLDEVPHRWLDDDQPRTSPEKPGVPVGAAAGHAAATADLPKQQLLLQRQSDAQSSVPELMQRQRPKAAAADTEMAEVVLGADPGRGVPIVGVAPPRPYVPIDQRCLLPPLGGPALDSAQKQGNNGQLGKHGLQESELHLPLKKRQRMMMQLSVSAQQHTLSLPSPHSHALGTSSRAGEALPGVAQPQASGGSADCIAAPATRPSRHSGGGAESAGGDMNGLAGRASLRHESSVTASGRISSVAAEEDDPNEDLDSLLEAAEAVAALRTAPISNSAVVHTPLDTMPLQPRHVRTGSAAGASAAVAMVQTAKVASPRHLAAVQRAGPPNGLPPHGGSRPSGVSTANPSSSSSGFIPYQTGGSRQHPSGYRTAPDPLPAHEGGIGVGGPCEQQQQMHGRNGRFSGDCEAGAGPGGSRGRNGNGHDNGYSNGLGSHANGDLNREDLLWKLVGIEKPKDLLPLFSGGSKKSRDGDAKSRRSGSDTWIAPSHPYGKLLRALEASELLPHADQLRLFAHQHNQLQDGTPQQLQQQPRGSAPHSHPPQQQQAMQQQSQTSAAAGAPATAEALALSAWQQLAQQQVHQHAHGLDSGSVAALFNHAQQQQAAAAVVAAAAAAASGGQLHHLHALQGHGFHKAAAAATVAAGLAGHMGPQQPIVAADASHWHQPVHAQPGSIIQDLVQMYVAQHATGSHPMLAMAGTTTVGGPRI